MVWADRWCEPADGVRRQMVWAGGWCAPADDVSRRMVCAGRILRCLCFTKYQIEHSFSRKWSANNVNFKLCGHTVLIINIIEQFCWLQNYAYLKRSSENLLTYCTCMPLVHEMSVNISIYCRYSVHMYIFCFLKVTNLYVAHSLTHYIDSVHWLNVAHSLTHIDSM